MSRRCLIFLFVSVTKADFTPQGFYKKPLSTSYHVGGKNRNDTIRVVNEPLLTLRAKEQIAPDFEPRFWSQILDPDLRPRFWSQILQTPEGDVALMVVFCLIFSPGLKSKWGG